MAGRKKVVETKPSKNVKSVVQENMEVESDSDSVMEVPIGSSKSINNVISQVSKPSVYISNTNLKSSDSDRIHLAQAINNFTIKSEQLLQEMKNFETFRESIAKLDILIDTKKQEYSDLNNSLEQNHLNQVKKLETTYVEMNKKLKTDYDDLKKSLDNEYNDRSKKLESEFVDRRKTLTNSFEDSQIDIKRKIAEDKAKYCETYAKELKMKFIKEEEYKLLMDKIQESVQNYNELKKNFDKQCDNYKNEETKKYNFMLKNEITTLELTHKANNATLQAQVEQQKKEILVLEQTIESLKLEIKQQRELTKEVAQASSKAQITQTISKN